MTTLAYEFIVYPPQESSWQPKLILMKKFLYFFGILALIAGFVSSCSKDDDEVNNDSKTSTQKKLIKKIDDVGGDDEYTTEYSYDSEGKCVSKVLYGDRLVHSHTDYKYEDNRIIVVSYRKEDNSLIDSTIISIGSNGFIESHEEITSYYKYLTKYEYDDKGQLISEKNYYGDMVLSNYTIYEWEDGNVVKEKYHEEGLDFEITYKYTNSTHKSPIANKLNLYLFPYFSLDPIHQKYGISGKNLPVSLIEGNDEELIEWTFDADGYPIRVANIYNSIEDNVIKYVWE